MLTRNLVVRSDPFDRIVDRFFNDSLFRPEARANWATVWGLGSRLSMDIYEDRDGYTFVAAVPGLSADDLRIETEGNVVRISGTTHAPALSAEAGVHTLRSEIGYGKFARSFELAEVFDADKIEAKLENGVLTLRVPKAEEAKPRTIKVSAS
jgi:HSP20 family protein